jgi:hypothetical protein
MKNFRLLIVPFLLAFFMSCDSDRQNAELGNSVDTTHEEGSGATIPTDTTQNDSTNNTQGNADPSGSIKKSNK